MRSNTLEQKVADWTNGCFCLNSGYYAGRGPTSSDLNSHILEMLYQGIKKDLGERQAANFVWFTAHLKDLSASSFIVAFERFFASKCELFEVPQRKEDRTRITAHGPVALEQAFAVMAGALAGGKRSEEEIVRLSSELKRDFLALRHEEFKV